MLSAQIRLNQHLSEWSNLISRYDEAVKAYGKSKAEYEYRVAVVKTTAKNGTEKVSVAWLDTLANADEQAHMLHLEFRGNEATIEGMRARLRWCQAMADALRSEVSTERAESQLYADSPATT
jgi:hypothetical protein